MSYLDRIQEIQSQIDESGNEGYEKGLEYLKSHSSGKLQSVIDTINKGGQVAIGAGVAIKSLQESAIEAGKKGEGVLENVAKKGENLLNENNPLGSIQQVQERFQNIAESQPLDSSDLKALQPVSEVKGGSFDFEALGEELKDPNAYGELFSRPSTNPYQNAMDTAERVGGGKPAGTGGAEGLQSSAVEPATAQARPIVEPTTAQARPIPEIKVEDTDYTDPFGNTATKIQYQSPENVREYQQLFGDGGFEVRGEARQAVGLQRFQTQQAQIERADPFGGEFEDEGGAIRSVGIRGVEGRRTIERGEDTDPFSTPQTREQDIGLRGQVARNEISNVDTTPLQSHELLDQTQTPLTSQGELRPTIAEPYEPPLPSQSAPASRRLGLTEETAEQGEPTLPEPIVAQPIEQMESASGLMETANGEQGFMGKALSFGEDLGKTLGIGGEPQFGLAGEALESAGTEGLGLAIDAGTIGALSEGAGAGLLVGSLALDLLAKKVPSVNTGDMVERVGSSAGIGFDPEAIKLSETGGGGTIV